ncbi:MAG TPA: amidohydrolase family protein [Acidimicrobiales bacterium]|nr:amidohydrolase family protein [Acidimicrobiales bacterium]
MTVTEEPATASDASALAVVDTDVHERADLTALVPYLDPEWRWYITKAEWIPDRWLPYIQPTVGGLDRADAKLPDGRPGGSDLDFLRVQLLDECRISRAILTGWLDASGLGPGWPEFKTALMRAYNDWMIENWVEREPRIFGSIHVNAHDPVAAAREIDRVGSHPKVVQVMLYLADKAFGEPFYHPIYEAAVRNDLVVGVHHSENVQSALGFHRYYVEWHTLVPQSFMATTVSLIFNGVFDKFPGLRVVMIEGGFSYVPHLMWRADQQYKELRSEVPWVKRLPSDIIRDQVRFATQPIEEMTATQLLQIVEQVESEEIICFSTDYPHWDFDSPFEALPRDIPEGLQRKFFQTNAEATYTKLPAASTVRA